MQKMNCSRWRFINLGCIAVAAIVVSNRCYGDTVLTSQSFESQPADTWTLNGSPTGTGRVTNTTTKSDSSARARSGSFSFQVAGTGTQGGNIDPAQTGSIEFTPYTFAGGSAAGTHVEVHLASISSTGANGEDGGDTLQLFLATNIVDPNNVTYSSTADLTINGAANAVWSYNATKTAVISIGANKTLNATAGKNESNYSVLDVYLTPGTSSIALKIVGTNNTNGEVWAEDDVGIVVPEPTSLALAGLGATAMLARRRRSRTNLSPI